MVYFYDGRLILLLISCSNTQTTFRLSHGPGAMRYGYRDNLDLRCFRVEISLV